MAQEPVSWSNIAGVPDGLSKLAGVAGTLVTVASNPKQWLRTHVFALVAEWVVTQIIDGAKYLLGWLFFGIDRTATILLDAADPIISAVGSIGDTFVLAINAVFDVALAVAHSAGLVGPPAAAFAVLLVSTALAVVLFATWRAFPVSTEVLSGGLEAIR